jgi:alginate O-acetyltransferase complex protein AlgI
MTFQGMAYVIDVWRGEHPVETDLVRFLAFKAFFPQLIAGPIERASHLLTQFGKRRSIDADKVTQAVWLLIYGYTIKIVIADGLAPIVDSTFIADQPFGWSVMLGTVAFGLQIYTDFYGYSLIAKGLSLLLGFELIWNFRFPYWAISPSDFWKRWHISLSRWLRDYLYIPLGGNRHGRLTTLRNLYLTMLLGGLWHGASWNFVGWGFLHGTALVAARYFPDPEKPGRARIAIGWALTTVVVFVGWFLFRATSLAVLTGMITAVSDNMEWAPVHTAILGAIVAASIPLFVVEWIQQRTDDDFFLLTAPRWITYPVLSCLCFFCLVMVRQYQASFIYFQF